MTNTHKLKSLRELVDQGYIIIEAAWPCYRVASLWERTRSGWQPIGKWSWNDNYTTHKCEAVDNEKG
ncbi:MAG: hypothetical protein MN733_24535 [Nitrososphaera sp.]|nr:hypothetical protein [Nitrososphaera sp.]